MEAICHVESCFTQVSLIQLYAFLLTLKSLVHIYRRKKSTWKISSVSTVHNVWPIHQAALSSLYLHVRRVNRDTHNGAI